MTQRYFRTIVRAGLLTGLALTWPLDAVARGGGAGAHPGGVYGGFGRGAYARGFGSGQSVRFGSRNGFQGRIGLGNRRDYYPSGGFGASGYYPAGPAYPYAASFGAPDSGPASVTTRSVIIHRGPAFGEPGYVSRPVVYRLFPANSSRPGVRRFKVERLEF